MSLQIALTWLFHSKDLDPPTDDEITAFRGALIRRNMHPLASSRLMVGCLPRQTLSDRPAWPLELYKAGSA